MAAAYVLMNVEAGKVGRALTGVKAIKGVKTAHAVAGPYDIITYVEAENLEKLGQRVLVEMHNLSGVRSTVTAIVFQ
jgi:DNA-binding Lrp family transcriptional regulator